MFFKRVDFSKVGNLTAPNISANFQGQTVNNLRGPGVITFHGAVPYDKAKMDQKKRDKQNREWFNYNIGGGVQTGDLDIDSKINTFLQRLTGIINVPIVIHGKTQMVGFENPNNGFIYTDWRDIKKQFAVGTRDYYDPGWSLIQTWNKFSRQSEGYDKKFNRQDRLFEGRYERQAKRMVNEIIKQHRDPQYINKRQTKVDNALVKLKNKWDGGIQELATAYQGSVWEVPARPEFVNKYLDDNSMRRINRGGAPNRAPWRWDGANFGPANNYRYNSANSSFYGGNNGFQGPQGPVGGNLDGLSEISLSNNSIMNMDDLPSFDFDEFNNRGGNGSFLSRSRDSGRSSLANRIQNQRRNRAGARIAQYRQDRVRRGGDRGKL